MTTIEKFKCKRRAKLFIKLAYLGIGLFFLNLSILIYWRNTTDVVVINTFYMALIAIAILVPIFNGLVFLIFSHMSINELNLYKFKIKEYRIRKYFSLAMNCILVNDFQGAKYYYDGFIPNNRDERTYLFAILQYMAIMSDNPDIKNNGLKKMNDLLEYYNPNNIKF